jgi:hypothetical protein
MVASMNGYGLAGYTNGYTTDARCQALSCNWKVPAKMRDLFYTGGIRSKRIPPGSKFNTESYARPSFPL